MSRRVAVVEVADRATADTGRATRATPPTRPLSSRYLSFVSATGLSTLGDAAWVIALTTTVTRLSDAKVAGLVLALAGLPRIVAMLGGGAMADRRGPARVMIGTDLARCLVMVVAAVGVVIWSPSLTLLVTTAAFLAFLGSFFVPASGAMRPQMLPPEHLVKGNALYLIGLRAGQAAGGPVGAWLLGLGGIAAVAVTNAASYLASAFATLRCAPLDTLAPPGEHDGTSTLRRIRQGARYVLADRPLTVLMGVVAVTELAGSGPINLGLILLSDHIGAGAVGAGLLLTAYTLGATATFLLSLLVPVGRHAGPTAIACMTGYAATLVALGHSSSLAGLVALYALLGATTAEGSLVLTSMVQQQLPPQARARVMSILALMTFGAVPLGNLTIGAMVQWLGVPTTMAVQGGLALAGAGAFAMNRGLRTARLG